MPVRLLAGCCLEAVPETNFRRHSVSPSSSNTPSPAWIASTVRAPMDGVPKGCSLADNGGAHERLLEAHRLPGWSTKLCATSICRTHDGSEGGSQDSVCGGICCCEAKIWGVCGRPAGGGCACGVKSWSGGWCLACGLMQRRGDCVRVLEKEPLRSWMLVPAACACDDCARSCCGGGAQAHMPSCCPGEFCAAGCLRAQAATPPSRGGRAPETPGSAETEP
mmetsp:Transcript_38030/g.108012  ORF Transcript_38030/g.108012 Transcript_38030/m.108012 type:complete len:221 (+) Transcript_38030:1090-1752(+)